MEKDYSLPKNTPVLNPLPEGGGLVRGKRDKPAISYKEFLIIPKRKKVWEDNPAKTCIEKNGFKHWDLVKAYHRTRVIVIGSIRSLKQSCITLRTQFDDKFSVSYKKTKLLYRFGGIVYVG